MNEMDFEIEFFYKKDEKGMLVSEKIVKSIMTEFFHKNGFLGRFWEKINPSSRQEIIKKLIFLTNKQLTEFFQQSKPKELFHPGGFHGSEPIKEQFPYAIQLTIDDQYYHEITKDHVKKTKA
jgi:hypothetical protein